MKRSHAKPNGGRTGAVDRRPSAVRRLARVVGCLLTALLLAELISDTAAAQFCAGDCNLDNRVAIDEIVVGVNIVLGLRNRHDCPPADADNDGAVAVDEVVRAVRNALDACPPQVPVCHDVEECPDPFVSCRVPGEFLGCGICRVFESDCSRDDDCRERGEGFICDPVGAQDCPCSPAIICQPGCSTVSDCGEGEECDASHRCVRRNCTDDPNLCPPNFLCQPAGPVFVCLRQSCQQDDQCSDAFCVNSLCYSELGTCSVPVP